MLFYYKKQKQISYLDKSFFQLINCFLVHLYDKNTAMEAETWPRNQINYKLNHCNKTIFHFNYIKTKHFFMEIIIYTFKQSVAKIFDSTTVLVSCKT